MNGGVREGAGRPKGRKDTMPRIRRTDILKRNRDAWDAWEQSSNALRHVREMLLSIVRDPEASRRDRIKAGELIETRGYGRVAEEAEQPQSQTLIIIRQGENGYQQLNPGDPEAEAELEQLVERVEHE